HYHYNAVAYALKKQISQEWAARLLDRLLADRRTIRNYTRATSIRSDSRSPLRVCDVVAPILSPRRVDSSLLMIGSDLEMDIQIQLLRQRLESGGSLRAAPLAREVVTDGAVLLSVFLALLAWRCRRRLARLV